MGTNQNWPTVTSWPGQSQWPGVQFPVTVLPSTVPVWLDGNQQAFSDLAGTLPVSSGLIRRINEPASAGGAWTAPTDPERPLRDSNSVRVECIGTAGGYELTRPAVSGLVLNSCTLVYSLVTRDCANGSPGMGFFQSDDTVVGIIASGVLWIYYGGTIRFSTLTIAQGVKNTIVVQYSPAGINASVLSNGVIQTEFFSVVLPATAIAGAWRMGKAGTAYLYASLTQAMVISRTVSSTESVALLSYGDAQIAPAAYPNDRALLYWVGDSIFRAVAATTSFATPFRVLNSVRSTKPLTENAVTATPGYGVTGIINGGPGTTYFDAKKFYSGARIKNVMIILLGTNDLANGNSPAYVLNGTGAVAGSGLYPLCDDARSLGFKVVLLNILPRSGALSISQVAYDTARGTVNADIATNWPAHADAFVDVRSVAGMGADGDSTNLTNYADGVHPTDVGHGLLFPTVASAVLALL